MSKQNNNQTNQTNQPNQPNQTNQLDQIIKMYKEFKSTLLAECPADQNAVGYRSDRYDDLYKIIARVNKLDETINEMEKIDDWTKQKKYKHFIENDCYYDPAEDSEDSDYDPSGEFEIFEIFWKNDEKDDHYHHFYESE